MAVVDGRRAFGQICARDAMALAIEKAKSSGVGIVTLINAPHIGRVGTYTMEAAQAGLIGIGMCNAGANVAVHGGKETFLGTNPISCAAPSASGQPVLIDLATSVFTEGKVGYYRNRKEELPSDQIVIDSEGKPTTVAADLYGGEDSRTGAPGSLKAIGAHKGSGLGVMVELLAVSTLQ